MTNKIQINRSENNTPTLNLANFDLTQIDFKTIDDNVLIQYLNNNERQTNEMLNQNNKANLPIQQQNQNQNVNQYAIFPVQNQNQTLQVNETSYEINNIQNRQPMLPQLYICHSNVTINYNFSK